MAIFRFNATTSKSTTDVFEYLSDMTNAAVWDPSISDVRRLDDGELGVGSRFRVTLGFLGRKLELNYEVIAFEPASRVVVRAQTGLFLSEDSIVISSGAPGVTEVRYVARLSGIGAGKVFDPLFGLAIRHFGRQAGEVLRNGFLR